MADQIRFTAWHPKETLASCFVVSPSMGLSCSMSSQIFSTCCHNNELLFSCPAKNCRTDENLMLSSGRPALNANKMPVSSRADATHDLLPEQSVGNLSGLFDFDSAHPERSKTKIIGGTSHSFFMGVIPFLNHSGLATSVYGKGCPPPISRRSPHARLRN